MSQRLHALPLTLRVMSPLARLNLAILTVILMWGAVVWAIRDGWLA